MEKKNSKAGLLVLLLKLGPKLIPLIKALGDELLIFAKTFLGIGTVGTAAVSAGLYAYVYTWQTGLGLIAFLIVHEYGHVWAMRKSGVKTSGMYFIPFMGAVAIMDQLVHSARNEAFISIMGPVFGFLLFVLPGYLLWQYTGSEAVAAVTVLCCFINLINLLPIMPLDGGRMLKSISYSYNVATSFKLILIISAVTAVGGWYMGFTLFALMSVIGFGELFAAFGISQVTDKIIRSLLRLFVLYLLYIMFWQEAAPTAEVAAPMTVLAVIFTIFLVLVLLVVFVADIRHFKRSDESLLVTLLAYPWRIVLELIGGFGQLLNLPTVTVRPIENYTPMTPGLKWQYLIVTIGVLAIHFAVMYSLSGTTTGSVFSSLLE